MYPVDADTVAEDDRRHFPRHAEFLSAVDKLRLHPAAHASGMVELLLKYADWMSGPPKSFNNRVWASIQKVCRPLELKLYLLPETGINSTQRNKLYRSHRHKRQSSARENKKANKES